MLISAKEPLSRGSSAMAKLQLVLYPSDTLNQKTKKITRFDAATRRLAQDMLETMYFNNGVGLAAPQVGVLKRIMVIDVAGEDEPRKPIVFINPEIVESSGEMTGNEGCLSFPGVFFEVRRRSRIVVKFQNLAGKEQKLAAADNLLCRAIQHELDHLEGQLFVDKAVSKLAAELELSKNGLLGETVDVSQSVKLPESERLVG